MQHRKIQDMKITPPKQTSGDYDTTANCPNMHQVCVCVGKRRSGKSTAVINLIEQMGYDYSIVVSPTMKSNKELMSRLNVLHNFEDPDDLSVVDQIKAIVQAEADALEKYREDLKIYNRIMNAMKDGAFLPDDELLLFFQDGDFKKPEHKWQGRQCKVACIYDDCMGSMLYSKPRKLNALSTYSRHVGQMKEGGAIGLSLYFLVQSFKAQSGGLNKVIRNQCTSMIIFKTKDQKEQADLADSCAGEISADTFQKVYEEAIGEGTNHEFLFVDLHRKPSRSRDASVRLHQVLRSSMVGLPGACLQVIAYDGGKLDVPKHAPYACKISQTNLDIDKTSSSIDTKLHDGNKEGLIIIWEKEEDAAKFLASEHIPVETSETFFIVEPIASLNFKVSGKQLSSAKAALSIYGKWKEPNTTFAEAIKGMPEEKQTEIGEMFGNVPGIIVKVFRGSYNAERNLVGGLYLFEDAVKCEEYLQGPVWMNGSNEALWEPATCEITKFLVE